jgi:GNAT superfamily N-acetyltransferase
VDDLPALAGLIPLSVRALCADLCTPAQIEGAIAGCGGWSGRRKISGGAQVSAQGRAPLDPAMDAARIRAFFVHPQCARRGVGSAIMRACARAAGEAGFRRLDLLGTLPGERLYRAFGFVVLESVDCAPPDGVIVRWVRMAREFQPADFS